MLQSIRKEKIVELLREKEEYKVDELCKYFGVSKATIHRDLNELGREGRVNKVHGGVLRIIVDDLETKNIIRLRTNVELKKKIVKKAMEFVENSDCIFLDNSTTCYYLAKEISKSKFQEIVIVTNSYLIPNLFIKNKNVQVVSTGGVFLRELSCFVGPYAVNTIREFNGNKFFFSVAAISVNGNLSDIYHPDSEEIKRNMFKNSKEHICLVDSSKFNLTGQSIVFSISEVGKIITDSDCLKDTREEFARIGKELIIA